MIKGFFENPLVKMSVAYHTELIIVPGFKLVRGYHVVGLLEQKGFEARPAVSVKLECRIGPFATKAEAEEVARTLQSKFT